ncbi:hypothetical protein JDV02_007722 [Purpureocillium takamizusanense]|uniref:Uncharacterized protein n=1 Tax=Purpureocillium takamizusanense TaxID=2060973 RepID=A0A9Q8QLE5_9HYPO|nr:uncharacterized protein JDV02_007722 [Purpureocillium takamizusanense]UNI21765.1 hypothetical protein JDV02_007722 [Purpureocillium takamizusanense]
MSPCPTSRFLRSCVANVRWRHGQTARCWTTKAASDQITYHIVVASANPPRELCNQQHEGRRRRMITDQFKFNGRATNQPSSGKALDDAAPIGFTRGLFF